MISQEKSQTFEESLEKKCKDCGHLEICAIFRAVGPLLKNWGEEAPIDPDNLAKVCRKYIHGKTLRILQGDNR